MSLVTWKSSKTLTGNSSGCEDSELMAFLRNFVVNANTGIVAGEDEILLSLLPLQTRVLVLAFPPFFKILRMLTLAKNFLPVDIISTYRKWVLVIVQSHVI